MGGTPSNAGGAVAGGAPPPPARRRRRPSSRAAARATALGCVAAGLLVPLAALADRPPTRLSHRIAVSSTAYCLRGGMADGTHTRPGAAASNRHPLGTRIRLERRALGRRHFRVTDRIGHGTELDLWTGSCSAAVRYGRRRAVYRW